MNQSSAAKNTFTVHTVHGLISQRFHLNYITRFSPPKRSQATWDSIHGTHLDTWGIKAEKLKNINGLKRKTTWSQTLLLAGLPACLLPLEVPTYSPSAMVPGKMMRMTAENSLKYRKQLS